MERLRIIAHIERTKSKGYAIYAEVFDCLIASDEASVEQAKNSFLEGIANTVEYLQKQGQIERAEAARGAEIEYVYDLPSLFALFKDVNVSQFSNRLSVSNEQIRQWRAGASVPAERLQELEQAIHQLGNELLAVRLV